MSKQIKFTYDPDGILLSRSIDGDRSKGHPASRGDRIEIEMPPTDPNTVSGKKVLLYQKDGYWEIWVEQFSREASGRICRCITTSLHDHTQHYDEA